MSKQTDLLNLTDAITVDSSNNVGIGNSNPSAFNTLGATDKLVIGDSTDSNLTLFGTTYGSLAFADSDTSSSTAQYAGLIQYYHADNSMQFYTGSSERMRLDASGSLLVGKITGSLSNTGFAAFSNGQTDIVADGGYALKLNRKTSDGTIVEFRKDSSTVGSIGTGNSGDLYIGNDDTGLMFAGGSDAILPTNATTLRDNVIDLGLASFRFDNIYATNGTIQTSDRNEKQDIEALSDAEQRVAQACKGLLRKFRWIDAVAEKGDNARIHFGIIAQDLQDAFAAEGLDAGRYAMFISSTWWETQTEVPAVEADEENGIEAKEAYTRTDTYETLEEAPEGATERTRLGVRYPELLAFIIGAM